MRGTFTISTPPRRMSCSSLGVSGGSDASCTQQQEQSAARAAEATSTFLTLSRAYPSTGDHVHDCQRGCVARAVITAPCLAKDNDRAVGELHDAISKTSCLVCKSLIRRVIG